jgi:oxygen-dependent protoporphyrinogen oxidase
MTGAARSRPSHDVKQGVSAVVIGAGIAGLSAAYDLRKAGFDVKVFEKWEFVGGRMRDAWMGPVWGPPHALGILQANREMFALGAELGISEQLDGEVGSDEYVVDNGIGIYPAGLRLNVEELRRVPGISGATKERVALLQPDLDRLRREVDPCLMTTGASEDNESIGDYYDRVLGKAAAREVRDYWIDVVLAAWGWPAYETSKMALLPWLSQQQSRVVVPRGGIGVLTSKLGSILPVQTRTTVRYVTPPDNEGRHTVHYLTPEGGAHSVKPDVVVCATEGYYIPSLIQGLDDAEAAFFKSIDFTKGGGVIVVLDEKYQPAMEFGAAYTPNHPDPQKRRVSAWSVSRAEPKAQGRPAMAQITLARPEVLKWQQSGKSPADYCVPLLQQFYPALSEDKAIKDIVTTMCDDLIFIPVGYIRRAARVVTEQTKTRRGLYYAGEFIAGAHTGAACASGRATARTIIKHWIRG